MLDLLLEDITLIQEKEDRQASGEGISVNGIGPDIKGLLNTELSGLLVLNVILVQGGEEDDRSQVLLRVDPLTTLNLLASNVNQGPLVLIDLKGENAKVFGVSTKQRDLNSEIEFAQIEKFGTN